MGNRVHDKAHHYIRHSNRKKLGSLLRKHPNLLASNDAMLIFTAIWNNRGMVKWLLHQKVSPDTRMGEDGNTPLMQAAADGDIPLMKLLLQFGADPNALNEERENPLGFAVTLQQPEAVRLLVENGADVNNMDDSGPKKTQLDCAELSEWHEVAGTLRSLGAKRYSELHEIAQ
jgi:ankyrin repeat protein